MVPAPGVPKGGLRLDEIAREIPGHALVLGDPSTRVFGVHHDSRAVAPGDLFVARKGRTSDGRAFLEQARTRGASSVLAEHGSLDEASAGIPILSVSDVASGFAYASAAIYGHPAFSLEIVGITGTNGKTTTAHLIRRAIDGIFGAPHCGFIGTVGHAFGDVSNASDHTTPEADEIARVMARFRADGATHVAMEVSSHALALGRVLAVRFRVAAFTNLTQDHLDFHGSMEAYAEAKARLFTTAGPGAAVINVGDATGAAIAARVRAPLVRVTTKLGAAVAESEIAPTAVTLSARGIEATLRTPSGPLDVRSRLVGAHNLENLVVAFGVLHALDLDLARAELALRDELGAPGRLERCEGAQDDIVVLVDYAHTPDALEKVLASVRAVTKARIFCVFGCGGDRDTTKRAPMGEAAARGADVLIVTNDNPRSEDPAAIAASIAHGVRMGGRDETTSLALRADASGLVVELDRAKAIALAVDAARAGDVVVIAGKGHEDYQIVGNEKRPFDDRVEARHALARRRARSQT
jgi:UDP-N-acetylmuramoyl-L-alanyl-D-glutamate--2,6-diaminopimelate ligase